MALVFMDGFDHYQAWDILKKWTGWVNNTPLPLMPDYNNNSISGVVIGSNMARSPGGQGLSLPDPNNPRGIYLVVPQQSTFVCGFNFNLGTNLYSDRQFISFSDTSNGVPSTTSQLEIRGDGAGHLRVSRNGTTLATSTNTFSLRTWYHLEIKATIHNSTGAYEVRINGSSTGWIPAATNQNTRGQTSNNWIDTVALHSAGTGTWSTSNYIDDFYFLSSTAPNNDFIGPQKITTILPNGVGNSAQFTGNYADNFVNVNEDYGDGDSTINQSSTAGHIDSFAFDNVPTGTIAAIQHVIQARQDSGAQRVLRPKTRIGTTNYNGTSFYLAGSHQFLVDPRDVSPATDAAWTDSEINGAEFGYELVS